MNISFILSSKIRYGMKSNFSSIQLGLKYWKNFNFWLVVESSTNNQRFSSAIIKHHIHFPSVIRKRNPHYQKQQEIIIFPTSSRYPKISENCVFYCMYIRLQEGFTKRDWPKTKTSLNEINWNFSFNWRQ